MDDGSDGSNGTDATDGGSTNGGTSEPVTIGVLYPGPIPDGDLTINGAEYAIEEVNANGGLLGREVEMVTANTELDPEAAGQEGRRLIEQENVDFLTGGYATGPILAVQENIAGSGPVYVASSVGGTQPLERITNSYDQYKYFFSPTPVSPLVIESMSYNAENTIADQHGFDSIVPVVEDHAYTEGFAEHMRSSTDLTVEDAIRFSIDTTDFSPVFSKVRDADSQLMMTGLAIANGPAFVTQWAENEVPAAMTGILVAANAPGFVDQVGSAANTVAPQQLGAKADITEVTVPFVEGYMEAYDSEPGTTAYLTYDALVSLFAGVEDAGTIDPDPVVDALESVSVPGTTGNVDYMTSEESDYPHNARVDPDDGVFYSQLQWQEDDDGNVSRKIVGPEQWADYDGEQQYQLPPWM
jgi:branched-chain amino acid transport system substrate-binding protein